MGRLDIGFAAVVDVTPEDFLRLGGRWAQCSLLGQDLSATDDRQTSAFYSSALTAATLGI